MIEFETMHANVPFLYGVYAFIMNILYRIYILLGDDNGTRIKGYFGFG